MKLIPLTQGKFAMVDDADFDWLNQWKWCASYDKKRNRWLAVRNDSKTKKTNIISMHRQIMGLSKRDGKKVDHINHDSLDNQRHNLRICSSAENSQNMLKTRNKKTSRYKGVYLDCKVLKKRWAASITCKNEKIFIGRFLTEIEAAKAYDRKAKELFGEFACLNFAEKERAVA